MSPPCSVDGHEVKGYTPTKVQGVILAGGLATRLRPLTDAVPKVMVDIQGKPFLRYQLDLLRKNDVNDIVLCVGHLADKVREHFGDGKAFGVRIRYSDEGPHLMGTAGALKKAQPMLAKMFLVLDGDSYLALDYKKIMTSFKDRDKLALMVVYKNHDRYDKSNTTIDGDMVKAYDRSRKIPGMVHIHAGLSVLRREALALIPSDRSSSQDELWSELIASDQLMAFTAPGRFYEVGSISGLAEFRQQAEQGVF